MLDKLKTKLSEYKYRRQYKRKLKEFDEATKAACYFNDCNLYLQIRIEKQEYLRTHTPPR